MKLYGAPLSGNAYKARLMLHLLGVEFEEETVDLAGGGNRTPAFLARNPRAQIPVLEDGATTVWDSQAVLAYLARAYGPQWLPVEPAPLAEVMQWLAVAQNELLFGLARARAALLFKRAEDLPKVQALGRAGLAVMDQHLNGREWLAAGRPTIADVACFPYVALAPQGDVPLDDYPNVRAWIRRVQALPGYVAMPGTEPAA